MNQFLKKELYNDPTIYVNITSKDVKNDKIQKNSENWFVMVNALERESKSDSEIKILKSYNRKTRKDFKYQYKMIN